ncbi:MAG: peptide ABC transporter substrate-binding protein, partial [Clostridia bacterium]|nr:peptide ABC transporter substrate-binding protein [Clostridia bacterium]
MWIVKNGKEFYDGACTADEVGIKAADERTFVVELKDVTPWFLMLTSTTTFLPVSKAAVEANEKWAWSPKTYVRNGPYMLKEYASLDKIVMVKNPNY